MRIDPEGTVAGYPALIVRRALRKLRQLSDWAATDLEGAAGLPPGQGRQCAARLRRAGLIESGGRGVWTVTQAGCTFAAATAAKRLTRATAERALAEFLERVARVNDDRYFLGKVTRVVLFGSMLNPEMDRPSDIDLAIEVVAKETDFESFTRQNRERAEELATLGHRFRNPLEVVACWYQEVFRFLKGRSRAISLADYKVEKALVLAVPHRMLLGDDEPAPTPAPEAPKPRRLRRRGDCPF
jgi:predicted nucleotidyltransferase